jgi:general nucleoside transport system permease protein
VVLQQLLDVGFLVGLLASSIRLATPFLFAALGETVSERAGVLNIGVEGMMLVGALAGFMGGHFTGNPWVGALCGLAAAALFSCLHGTLSVLLAGSQVVSGLATNLLSLGLATFLIRALFGVAQTEPSTPTFPLIHIPWLSDIPIFGAILFRHNVWVYASWLLVPIAWLVLFRSPWGLKVTAAGENPIAAESAGVNVRATRFLAVVIGGGLAGLGGMLLSLSQLGYFRENMVSGRGFIALAMVTMGRWNPVGVLFAALIFGIADSLQFRLQATGAAAIIPAQILISLPYVVAILVVLQKVGRQYMPGALAVPYQGSEQL